MKKILLALMVLSSLSTGVWANMEKTFVFEDQVMKVSESEDSAEILFKKHAARYKVLKEGDDSLKLIEELKTSIDAKRKVKVEVDSESKQILLIKKDE